MPRLYDPKQRDRGVTQITSTLRRGCYEGGWVIFLEYFGHVAADFSRWDLEPVAADFGHVAWSVAADFWRGDFLHVAYVVFSKKTLLAGHATKTSKSPQGMSFLM